MTTIEALTPNDAAARQAVAELRSYAFEDGPITPGSDPRSSSPDPAGTTFLTRDGKAVHAAATVLDLTANVRGAVLPAGGVAAVVTHPDARRSGQASLLLRHLLRQMWERGVVVSCLYPFRASFYSRLGYTPLAAPQRVQLTVRELAPLADVPDVDKVSLCRPEEGTAHLAVLLEEFQRRQHGMVLARPAVADPGWVALLHRGDRPVAALQYRLTGYGMLLSGSHLLASVPQDRTALLGWIGRHAGQVTTASLQVLPHEKPELWQLDLEVRYESAVSYPRSPAPMARIVRVEALSGASVGSGTVCVHLADELLPANTGTYTLGADRGRLTVERGGRQEAETTISALTAMLYGSVGPSELAACGCLAAEPAVMERLAALLPPVTPYLYLRF